MRSFGPEQPAAPRRRQPAALPATLLAACLALAFTSCRSAEEKRLEELGALQRQGRVAETTQPLREMVASEPQDGESNYLLGKALAASDHKMDAVDPLIRAVRAGVHVDEAGLQAALLLLGAGQNERALEVTQLMLAANPRNMVAWSIQGRAHLGLHDDAAAAADGERVMEIDPTGTFGPMIRGQALEHLGRLDEADQAFQELARRARSVNNTWDQARACSARVRIAEARRDHQGADALLETCQRDFGTNEFVVRAAADLWSERGDRARALDLLRDALAKNPTSEALQAALIQQLVREGQLDEADRARVEAAEKLHDPLLWVAVVQGRRQQGDRRGALAAAERGLTAYPDDPLLKALRAKLLLETGDVRGAERDVSELPPPYRDLVGGEIALATGDARKALELAERAVTRAPASLWAHALLGHAAEDNGDFDRALREYQSAVRLAEIDYQPVPVDSDAALAAARLTLALGQAQEASGWADRAARLRPQDRPRALELQAEAETMLGRPDRANAAADALAALPGQRLRGLLAKAHAARQIDGPAAAIGVLEKSGLDFTEPANAPALRALVEAQSAVEGAEAAVATVRRSLARRPESPVFQALLGSTLLRANQPEQAGRELERALAAAPGLPDALVGVAALEEARGHRARAIELYDQAAAADPDDGTAAAAAAHLVLAAGDPAAAEKRLRKLVTRYPEQAGAAAELATLLADRNTELELALAFARRAVAQERTPETLDALGWVLYHRSDAAEAARVLGEASQLAPEGARLALHRGLALARLGRSGEARQALERAIAVEPGSPEASLAQEKLAELDAPPAGR
jgi:tetratricopeptide (TPR) repeat protein